MEQKDIQFRKGIYRAPSLATSEGELSECVNLIPKNGELVNVKPAVDKGVVLLSGETLLCIHETAEYKHYITSYAGSIWYWSKDSNPKGHFNTGLSAAFVKQVVPIGNSLSVIYEQEKNIPMAFLLWYAEYGKHATYKIASNKPSVNCEFKLVGETLTQLYRDMAKATSEESDQFGLDVVVTRFSDIGDREDNPRTLDGFGLVEGEVYGLKIISGHSLLMWTSEDGYYIGINEYPYAFKYSPDLKFFWKVDNETPTTTGLHFAILARRSEISESGGIGFRDIQPSKIVLRKNEENFNAVMGNVKKYIETYSVSENKLIFPFFVRYSIKMIGGSYMSMSSPILMIPNGGTVPYIAITGSEIKYGEDGPSHRFLSTAISARCCDLHVKASVRDLGAEWKSLATGVVIAISSPIYSLNLSETYKEKSWNINIIDGFPNNPGVIDGQLYQNFTTLGSQFIVPPVYTKENYRKNHLNNQIFYIVKEYTWEELEKLGEFAKVDLSGVNINTLETYSVLPDVYNGQNEFYPLGGFAYNNRLNIYNIKEKILPTPSSASPTLLEGGKRYKFVFYIRTDGPDVVSDSGWSDTDVYLRWMYYPNANTYKCVVFVRNGEDYKKSEIQMERHPWLNGAYALLDSVTFSQSTSEEANMNYTTNNYVNNENAIYSSNANNPFSFPVSGQSTVGTGVINGVSTSAKAISTGQYGQFPLYAFASDGIWAMSVDDQGRYDAPQPTNRDVVTNMNSVCQIDESLVYASKQGLKQLAGSDTRVLSGAMEGWNVDEDIFFSDLDTNHQGLKIADTNSIVNMLETCKVLYDNAGGRKLHIYPEGCETSGKHYIYDLDNDAWTTAVGNDGKVKAIVAGYPFSTMQNVNGSLMEFNNEEDNDTIRHGVLLTREMAFDNPFTMKILADLRMIYTKRNPDSKCKISIFVSNDRVTWKKLTSLRKHSYKWYRFRIQTSLTDMDALTAVSCLVDERRTNKLR